MFGQGARAPRRSRPGILVQCYVAEALHEFACERRFASGTRAIGESVEAGLREAASPQHDGLAIDVALARPFSVLYSGFEQADEERFAARRWRMSDRP